MPSYIVKPIRNRRGGNVVAYGVYLGEKTIVHRFDVGTGDSAAQVAKHLADMMCSDLNAGVE